MAGNAIQVSSSTGAIRVKNDGIVVAGAGDPCCCDSGVCKTCEQITGITVTLSGITLCSACFRSITSNWKITGYVGGTFDLAVSGSDLCFYSAATDSATASSYYDSVCTQLFNSWNTVEIAALLNVVACQIVISVSFLTVGGQVFSAVIPMKFGTYTVNNLLTACSTYQSSGNFFGFGGSAEVTVS